MSSDIRGRLQLDLFNKQWQESVDNWLQNPQRQQRSHYYLSQWNMISSVWASSKARSAEPMSAEQGRITETKPRLEIQRAKKTEIQKHSGRSPVSRQSSERGLGSEPLSQFITATERKKDFFKISEMCIVYITV